MTGRRTLCGIALVLGVAFAASGQEGDEQQERDRWGRKQEREAPAPQLHPKVRERHGKALSLIFEERWDEAQAELDKLFMRRYSAFNKAKVHAAYGFIANGRGDRGEARKRFQAAIDEEGFDPTDTADMRFKIAGLWMQDEEWKKAADTLELWFETTPDEPNASSYYLLALCHYQNGDYAAALEPAETAVTHGPEPKEGWLQLVLALHLLEKRYQQAIPVLQTLVSEYPKKSYWVNLSTVHGALGSYENALVPLQLAYEEGLLEDGKDLQRMAQMMMFLGVPYRAAETIRLGIDEGKIVADSETLAMLANGWIAAREYEDAIPPLGQAAALSEDGELFLRLAQVHVQREEFDPAATALGRALEKGGLRTPGNAQLLLGIVNYSRERPALAERAFQSASRYDETRAEAEVWLGHLAQERAQAEAAAAAAAAQAEAEAEAAAAAAASESAAAGTPSSPASS